MKRVSGKIRCKRTLELIRKAITGGYVDPEKGNTVKSNKGTPQGSILSPMLSNIVLHELDEYLQKLRDSFEKGTTRKRNQEYMKILQERRNVEDIKLRRKLLSQARKLSSYDKMDPEFKRMKYVRYADDFVILVAGNLADAEQIKVKVKDVLLKSCGLELNNDKTIVTNLQTEGFKFLGATCTKAKANSTFVVKHGRSKTVRAKVRLRVNADIYRICDKLVKANIAKRDKYQNFRGTANNALINFSHADTLAFYNSK